MGFWQWLYGGITGNRDGLMFDIAMIFLFAVIVIGLEIAAIIIAFTLLPYIGIFADVLAGVFFILVFLRLIYSGTDADSRFADAW